MGGHLSNKTDPEIIAHQDRVKQESLEYEHMPVRMHLTSNFGDGIASLGEYYRSGNGRYCRDHRHCRSEATVVRIKKRKTVSE